MSRQTTCRALLAAALVAAAVFAGGAEGQEIIARFDRPFLFAYGTWDKRARTENGVARLDADGMTPQGGAGIVQDLNLAAHAADCPGVRVQVGPRNTLKALRLALGDAGDHTGTWRFPLPPASAGFVLVTPLDGASFANANEPGKTGPPDLAHITQLQIMGDWGGDGAVDLRVESVLAVQPDETIRTARANRIKHDEEARIQAAKDREADRARYGRRTPDSPQIQAVYAVAPDILALRIHTGRITPCSLTEYRPLPGDTRNDNGGKDRPHLIRGGKDLGMLIGPTGRETGLVTFEGFTGDPLLLAEADDPANYTITSPDDPAFAAGVTPIRVMRKSKPDDWQQPTQPGLTVCHGVYLKLPHRLNPGKTYRVALGHVNTQQAEATLVFDTSRAWSEAVHVNQVGFRPDDPLKRAYLSLWMGTAGGVDYPAGLAFHVVDARTGKRVTSGTVGAAWPADRPEKMATTRNFNGAAVAPIDFADFRTPGLFRLEVEGVGCSYPFAIGADTWAKAFRTQMKGFYNQRSGVDLGPPYTAFVRPACWKPGVNGCMPITQSTYTNLPEKGSPAGQDWPGLEAHDTGKPVPEAWGGYHDAGDWNPRRITHMTTTTFWQLELLQLCPAYFEGLKLNIPDTAPGPDLLKECLFELDLFRRLQMPDGGVRFGIETNGDPAPGEVSWKQHMPAYVYAPDMRASYLYAAIAARASQVLQRYDTALARTYAVSALKAMRWVEDERAKRLANGTWDDRADFAGSLTDDRLLAAVCLYALTRDERWNGIFLAQTELKGATTPVFRGRTLARDAAFTYARLPAGLGDARVKQNARYAILSDADGSLAYERNNAFGIASDDPGRPQFIGFYSNPHGAVSLVRAYHLSGDRKYLAGALQACLFPAGANPSNLVYTTGVGANPVRHVLNLDALATGQPTPAGLTPYGIIDLKQWHDDGITWPFTWFLGKACEPSAFEWPTTESYFDVRLLIMENEFCIDQTMGPNAYVWGYLAAHR
jgi:endoglucanase